MIRPARAALPVAYVLTNSQYLSYVGETPPLADLETAGGSVSGGTVYASPDGILRAVRWGPTPRPSVLSLNDVGLNPLGKPPGPADESTLGGVNRAGAAVGRAHKYDPQTGAFQGTTSVRWNAGTRAPVELGGILGKPIEGNVSAAYPTAISDSGVAAGYGAKTTATGANRGTRAVRWNANSSVAIELEGLGLNSSGSTEQRALAVNPAGTVVGWSYTAGGVHAVRWNAGGIAATDLGSLGGTAQSKAHAVNVAGDCVGYSDLRVNNISKGTRPTLWRADSPTLIELQTLGTYTDGSTDGCALDINDAGTIAGYVYKYGTNGKILGQRAVRWDRDGVVTELQTLSALPDVNDTANAFAINASGAIAGFSHTLPNNSESRRATVWLPGSVQAIDLNTLIDPAGNTRLLKAYDISDTGIVTGAGYYDNPNTPGDEEKQILFSMLVPEAGTYGRGDADFDADIDFDDLLVLAKHFNQSTNGSTSAADFDLDGTTDFDDLLTLAKHFNTAAAATVEAATGDAAFASQWALAQSVVPEPATMLIFAGTALTIRRRRR